MSSTGYCEILLETFFVQLNFAHSFLFHSLLNVINDVGRCDSWRSNKFSFAGTSNIEKVFDNPTALLWK